uniref:Cuticular protein RR family n=1 Tax=Anopheles farauti TaxID=69004 RepID=A0A182Q0G0_9DIPT
MMWKWKFEALLLLVALCACAYAIDEASLKQHKRTAKLIRNYPNYGPVEQRVQALESPMYNFIDPYGPGTYAFGYEVEDPQTGNVQFRDEEKLKNGTVRGSYGYMQPDGSVIITNFVADDGGYRAKTEIKRANGQTIASFPAPAPSVGHGAQDRYFPVYDQQASTINPAVAAVLQQQQHMNLNPTYNPMLDPAVIDPQYASAILGHIRDQQYSSGQGLIHYPYGIPQAPFAPQHQQLSHHLPQHQQQQQHQPLYDTPGNAFTNFIGQFPANLNPYNVYQNLQSTFPQVLPQQNPLDQLANNIQGSFQTQGPSSAFGNFFGGSQSPFQQLVPQGFGNWFGQNRVPVGFAGQQQQQQFLPGGYGFQQQQQQQQQIPHHQILSSNRPTNVLGDMPIVGPGSMMMNQHYVPTTRRRKLTGTTKKRNKLKTRDNSMEWFDDFLENRKRQVMYNAGMATTPETMTEVTLQQGSTEGGDM